VRPRTSLLSAGSLAQVGKAGFLPEMPAKTMAPATGSLLAAAGKPAFGGPYADLHVSAEPKRLSTARALASLLARFVDWVMESAERARRRELERYLGQSVDLCDLERRLRELERSRGPVFGSHV